MSSIFNPWSCKHRYACWEMRMSLTSTIPSHSEEAKHLDPGYCGECGGAPAPPNAVKPGCCNTCEEVREAYAQKQWAFGKGANIEQCEREHY